MSVAVPGAPFLRVRPAKRGDKPTKWGNPGLYFIALLLIGVSLGPVVYIVLGGFRTNSQITVSPAGLPHPWVFSNYTSILKSSIFWGEFKNSVIVAAVTTVGIVVLGIMVSFALARYEFKLKGAMYALFASGLMFPLVIAITPLFIIVKSLGLIDHLTGIIVPEIAFGLPTTVIILSQAFVVMPGGFGTLDELFEALTLVQTRKVTRFPVILCGSAYWQGLIDWIRGPMLESGKVSAADLDLIQVSDDVDEIVASIVSAHHGMLLDGGRP